MFQSKVLVLAPNNAHNAIYCVRGAPMLWWLLMM